VDSAKSSAGAALSEAQAVRDDLGAEGQTPNTYDRIKNMTDALSQLQTAAEAISESQVESGTLASEILTTLTKFVNESSKALGLGEEIEISELGADEADDGRKVHDKLNEINAKLDALKESVEMDKVVVKTWFEGSEGE